MNIFNVIPVVLQLFGPVQYEGALHGAWGHDNCQQYNQQDCSWIFPGNALTASTKAFFFQYGYPKVVYARWVIVWTCGNIETSIRLVYMDGGPKNIQEIDRIDCEGHMTPVVRARNITIPLNQLINDRIEKHLGFQTRDNGWAQWTLYESRLEILYDANQLIE